MDIPNKLLLLLSFTGSGIAFPDQLTQEVSVPTNRLFSHDVMVAISMSRKMSRQTSPLGAELFYYAKAFFCSNKLT